MNAERLERLKERYRYREWDRGAPKQPPLKNTTLDGLSLPGWKIDHVDAIQAEGHPPLLQSVWRGEAPGKEEALSLALYRCESVERAREYLLRLLDEFQSPLMARIEGPEARGDVAFAPPGGHSVLFSVANLVVLLRNVGRDLVPVASAAAVVEEHLKGR